MGGSEFVKMQLLPRVRCNYYHEYEEEDLCEGYILLKLLSGERLVILLKIAQLQLNGTWEAKPAPK